MSHLPCKVPHGMVGHDGTDHPRGLARMQVTRLGKAGVGTVFLQGPVIERCSSLGGVAGSPGGEPDFLRDQKPPGALSWVFRIFKKPGEASFLFGRLYRLVLRTCTL